MVDMRYKSIGDKFLFFEHFENIYPYRNGDYRAKQAEYHYCERLSSFLHKDLSIKKDIALAVANCVTGRTARDFRNKYHNTLHVLSMLDFARANDIELSNDETLAIFFHDCIYDVEVQQIKGSGQNEGNSASLLMVLLSDYTNILEAKSIVYATSLHSNLRMVDAAYMRILDLDLSTFAYPYKSFKNAQHCLYQEYCSGKQEKNEGTASQQYKNYLMLRYQFVDSLFSRDGGLYQTEEFKRFEKKAKNNEAKFREENYDKLS